MTTTTANPDGEEAAPEPDDGHVDSPEFPRAFGQYVLLHCLARGGMGNVFLAKTGGSMGIEKHCVVKTLRAQFTGDAEYVSRFMEEARVVVQLTHRNICPVFDVGRVGGTYYLAMELVVGRDVRSLQVALEESGRNVPLDCAIHIVAETLDALDYAHRHADPVSGVPLNLVHRDVSPQNVMINTEGEIKLIDFGLAETRSTVEQIEPINTGAITVMGKIAYMAPEHARGDPVDARADQFAAGVLAFELFAGERYYEGLSNHQVWQRAGSGTWQASGMKKLDVALQQVLRRALAPDREARYASCGDFRDELLAYARARGLHAGARDLRGLMQQTFVDDVREMRELLQRFAHVSRAKLPGFVAADETQNDYFSIATSQHVDHMPEPTEMLTKSAMMFASPTPTRSWPVVVSVAGVGGVAVVAVAIVVMAMSSRPPEVAFVTTAPPPTPPVVAQPAPPSPVPAPVVATPTQPEPEPAEPARASSGKRRPPRVTPPEKKTKAQFGTLTPPEKIKLLRYCQPCGPPLADQNIKELKFEEIRTWNAKAKDCLLKCGAVVP